MVRIVSFYIGKSFFEDLLPNSSFLKSRIVFREFRGVCREGVVVEFVPFNGGTKEEEGKE